MDLLAQAQQMAKGLPRDVHCVYILRLRSGLYYVGATANLEMRLRGHQAGSACRTTRIDPPAQFLWLEVHSDFSSARQREAQIKKWSRAKKESLMTGDSSRLKILSISHEA